jgi:hypothetical protein
MTKRSTKSGAINWRHEPKGPGYAEHVYVTLTDGRRAELLAWDIPAHSDGLYWLDRPFDPDRDWPRQVGLEIYVKDQRGRYFTQLTRQRYPDFETAKREAETLARTDPARWPPEAPWPDPDMPPARRNKILAEQAAVERVIAAGELAGRPIRANEVTSEMLEPVRKAADDSCLPMTVWPSNNIGVRFAGLDALITFVPAELGKAPADAFQGSGPLLTMLPKTWHHRK